MNTDMSTDIWLTLISIAVGTYLLRLVPHLWMQHQRARHENSEVSASTPDWLTVMGPGMIAAMFGTSVVPMQLSMLSWMATAAGLLATLLVWRKTRSMGLPTLAGVLVFGLVKVVFA